MKNVHHLAFYHLNLRHFTVNCLLTLILAVPLYVSAEMYKWVDEAGAVHYSQSPPPAGIQATIVKPPPAVDSGAAQASLQSRLENLDKALQERQEAASQARESELETAGQERLCQQARARLASYERPRISVPAADGGERRLGEEERQQELQRSRDLIDELCR